MCLSGSQIMAYNGIEWLPELLLISDYNNDWEEYIQILYQYFSEDFIHHKPIINGYELRLKRYPLKQGKEATFWHLITRGKDESTRLPDIDRCERIRWPKPIILNLSENDIKAFSRNIKGENRIHLWLESLDYVVVIAERYDSTKNEYYYLPWTAFCIDENHTRRKFEKYYNAHKKANAALFGTAS